MIDAKLPAGCDEAARRPPKAGVATATSTRRPRCTPQLDDLLTRQSGYNKRLRALTPQIEQASSRAARHPGLRRDYEWWLRQPLPAELAQCRAPIGLEAGDVRTRRGDAERERLPPVLERGVLDVHRDGAVDDVPDSSRAKEVGQVAGPAAGADRPSLDLRIERLGGIPERTDRAAVGEVPHACGDAAAVPRHPRHLAEACDRIVHDVDHELGERRIEAASFERQILSRRADDLDSGMAAA